jgi:hypothetical protein
MQYVVQKCLRVITKAYSKGINTCLQKGISYFMVAEDVFTFGKPLLQALVEFRQAPRPKESEDQISDEQKRFLIDNDLTLTKMQQDMFLNQWKTLSDFLSIFHFEAELRTTVLLPLYPVIAEQAESFITKSTRPYYTALFRTLKVTYIPVLLDRIRFNPDNAESLLRDYH